MAERWRPVKGYEGKYIVSNKGNVMSVPRQKSNIPMLRELVSQWVQMATQKTAGQRNGNRKDLSWDNMKRVKMGILCEAVALVLSGDLDRLEALKDADD